MFKKINVVKSLQVTQMSYIWFYNNDFTLNYWQVTITEVDQCETISDTGMLMNYDNTIMEILQKITISAVVVLMNCDKLTIKGKITRKNNLIGMKRLV